MKTIRALKAVGMILGITLSFGSTAKADVILYNFVGYSDIFFQPVVLDTCPSGTVIGGCNGLPSTFLEVFAPEFFGTITISGFAGGATKIQESYENSGDLTSFFNFGPNDGGPWDLTGSVSGIGFHPAFVEVTDCCGEFIGEGLDPVHQIFDIPQDGIDIQYAPEPGFT